MFSKYIYPQQKEFEKVIRHNKKNYLLRSIYDEENVSYENDEDIYDSIINIMNINDSENIFDSENIIDNINNDLESTYEELINLL